MKIIVQGTGETATSSDNRCAPITRALRASGYGVIVPRAPEFTPSVCDCYCTLCAADLVRAHALTNGDGEFCSEFCADGFSELEGEW